MSDQIIDNHTKIAAIAGEGEGNPLERAADTIGISRRSAYNAVHGRVSARTQRLIDEAYATATRGTGTAKRDGNWIVSDVTGDKTKGAWGECIVANDGDPPFVARVIVRPGKRADEGPLGRADVLIVIPPAIAGQVGAGALVDEAREIGYRHLTRYERQHGLMPEQRRRIEEKRAARKGDLTAREVAQMDMGDLVAVVRSMSDRELAAADTAAEQMERESEDENARLRAIEDIDEIMLKDAFRAARLRERAAWIRRIVAETRVTREPAPGLDHVRWLAKGQTRRVEDGEPVAARAAARSPMTVARNELAAEAVTSFYADLKEWGATAEELAEISDHMHQSEAEIRGAAGLGRDEAFREARARSGVIKRRITRFIRSDI